MAAVLAIDTSALLRRYVRTSGHGLVTEAMADVADAGGAWCASALARAETLQAIGSVTASRRSHDALWAAVRDDWERFHVVPVDDRCLARATEIGAAFRVRTADAIHLAAADRVHDLDGSGPVRFLTFDRRQIPAAAALGFDVIAPVDA